MNELCYRNAGLLASFHLLRLDVVVLMRRGGSFFFYLMEE